jgi:hypothetical protein
MSADIVDVLHAAEDAMSAEARAGYCRATCEAEGVLDDCQDDDPECCGCPCHWRDTNAVAARSIARRALRRFVELARPYAYEAGRGPGLWPEWIDAPQGDSLAVIVARPVVLIERNVRGSNPPHYITLHADPESAGRYHFGQEYQSDWSIVDIVNVVTGDVYDIEVRPVVTVTGVSRWPA